MTKLKKVHYKTKTCTAVPFVLLLGLCRRFLGIAAMTIATTQLG